MSEQKKMKRRAKRDLEEFRLTYRRARKSKQADAKILEDAERSAHQLKKALTDGDVDTIEKAVAELEGFLENQLVIHRPNAYWETFKALLIAVMIALFIRWMFIEPFRIPSGSMIPTLLIGDQLMVNRLSFGPDILVPFIDPDQTRAAADELKKKGAIRFSFRIAGHKVPLVAEKLWTRRLPRRGEVIVFRFPNNPKEDYIKRVIGLPGDKVEVKNKRLYINDRLQERELVGPYTGPNIKTGCASFDLYEETLESEPQNRTHDVIHCHDPDYGWPYINWGPEIIPEGMLFCMGDNRDCSSDGRAWGYVPVSHLKGTAMFIHLPLNPDKYYVVPRWNRFFMTIR